MTVIHDLDVGRDGRPLPTQTSTNRPFWEATKRHELELPRCPSCGRWVYPISAACSDCDTDAPLEWQQVSGRGTVSSWVVYHRPFFPFKATDVPYAVLEVQLEEGPRLMAAPEGLRLDEIRAGLPVRASYREVDDGITMVLFGLDDERRDAA